MFILLCVFLCLVNIESKADSRAFARNSHCDAKFAENKTREAAENKAMTRQSL